LSILPEIERFPTILDGVRLNSVRPVDDLPHFQHKEQPADMDNHTAAKAAKTYTARRIRLTISKGTAPAEASKALQTIPNKHTGMYSHRHKDDTHVTNSNNPTTSFTAFTHSWQPVNYLP
jgi:hypothetical protein